MSEASMRSNLVKKLKSRHAVAIESPGTGIGIPDVNLVDGWIECKWMKSWPTRCEINPVRFLHPLSKEQQIWLWKREKAGGMALVCAQVSREWFFWSGYDMRKNKWWNNMTRSEMKENSVAYFRNGLDAEVLTKFIQEYSEWIKKRFYR